MSRLRISIATTYRTVATALAAWMLLWTYLSWPYGQDDALIHLRYADHLLHQHMVSYDGIHPSFGSSSLLYLALLTCLRAFTDSPVLPRAVSSVAHVLLFFGIAVGLERALKNAFRVVWLFAMLLLAILVMPSAVRWLDDGMETSLCLCLVALLVFALTRLAKHGPTLHGFLWLAVLGFLLVLARVELLLLTGIAALMLFSAQSRPASLRDKLLHSAAPLLGGLTAAALIVGFMHSLLPDTAVAKSAGIISWRSSLIMTASVLESSFTFGSVLVLLWLLSFSVLAARRFTFATLAANSLFPCVVLLAALRGQVIQGVRYLEWTVFFSVLWNVLQLAELPSAFPQRVTRFAALAAYALFAVLFLGVPVEAHFLRPVFDARGGTLNRFRTEHLELLRDQHGIAADVGMIGYFTQAGICDPFGLVDGRDFARLSYPQRLTACAASKPDFLFASQDLIGDLLPQLGLDSWVSCGSYSFANIKYHDVHYLLAPPWNAALVCKATGQSPVPLKQVLAEHEKL
jgi:hypothetical protein